MRTTIYIHIGVHKTGSKSIQYTLSGNREALLASGINYLEIDRNHGPFLISLLSDEPHKNPINIHRLVDTPEKAVSYNAANRKRLTKALQTNRSPKFVISGEGFSAMPARLVPRLKEMLEPYAAAFRIIVYVRDPYEYVNSAFLQHVKSGRSLEANIVAVPGYRFRIGKYIRAFGRENVDIRVFDPARFVGGDLVTDFLTALGEPASLAGSLKIERANQSMSHEAAVILSEANKAIPAHIDGLANRARASTLHLHLADIKGEKFWLDPDLYLEREEEVLDDLAWLDRTLGGQTALEKPVPRPGSAARWSDATTESIRDTVSRMAKTVNALRLQPPRRLAGSVLQRFRREEKDFSQALPTDLSRVELPSSLRWLAEAIGQPASGVEPQLDQATIRDLAVFLHNMALTIERLHTGKGAETTGFFGRLLARAP